MNRTNKNLEQLLLEIKSEEEMSDFLSGVLTPKELLDLRQRLQIIKLLKRRIPQHQIAAQLGVGVATVTRGSKELQNGRFKNV